MAAPWLARGSPSVIADSSVIFCCGNCITCMYLLRGCHLYVSMAGMSPVAGLGERLFIRHCSVAVSTYLQGVSFGRARHPAQKRGLADSPRQSGRPESIFCVNFVIARLDDLVGRFVGTHTNLPAKSSSRETKRSEFKRYLTRLHEFMSNF